MDIRLCLVNCRVPCDDYKLPGTAYLILYVPNSDKNEVPKFSDEKRMDVKLFSKDKVQTNPNNNS